MNFIFIVGPPAVGKMTVGQELAKRLDYRLFHNHHSIELALDLFYFGSDEFEKINQGIRQLVFSTAAQSDQLKGLIFTLVWAFDYEEDRQYVEDIKQIFAPYDWNFYFVELYAPLELRLGRNISPNRLAHKQSKRDLERSEKNLLEMEKQYRMNTAGTGFGEGHYLWIDNTDLSPTATVERIIDHFGWS